MIQVTLSIDTTDEEVYRKVHEAVSALACLMPEGTNVTTKTPWACRNEGIGFPQIGGEEKE